MTRLVQILVALLSGTIFLAPASAKKREIPPLPAKILQANTVFVDCVCPRALGVAQETAVQQIRRWGRFQVSANRHDTDLVLLFSGNPYLGDYVTRDGPDKRPVMISATILTVIDPKTGTNLWTDSRNWGSWRVSGATKDLIEELRGQIEGQTKTWSLNEILMCTVTPVYADFAHLTREQALAHSVSAPVTVTEESGQLALASSQAPEFCKRAQFLFDSQQRIIGFIVTASRADDLPMGEVLQGADRFDFTGGKYANGDQVFFTAQSKDKKVLIQFTVENHRSVLSRVSFFY